MIKGLLAFRFSAVKTQSVMKKKKMTRAEFSVDNVRMIQLMHKNSEGDIC